MPLSMKFSQNSALVNNMDDSFDKWITLKNQMKACGSCYLKSEKRLLDNGNRKARIMIVGDIPTIDDLEKQTVFGGETGKYINGLLEFIGIEPTDVYMTYLVNCNGIGAKAPKTEAIDVCIKCLRAQFSLIRPEIVITLGRIASQTLISKDFVLGRDHGKFFNKGKVMFMGTYNPSSFLYDKKLSKIMLDDFLALKDFCDVYPPYKNTP